MYLIKNSIWQKQEKINEIYIKSGKHEKKCKMGLQDALEQSILLRNVELEEKEEQRMGQVSKLYETIYGFYKIIVEDGAVTAVLKKPEPASIEEKRLLENHVIEGDVKREEIVLMEEAYHQLCEYLSGKRKDFELPLNPKGTEFQKKVWKALCDIPYGEIRSYKDIAIAVGSPKACRAVGMANHVNPIIIVVPCHRVIGSSGKIVGYGQGIDMQIHLLRLEGVEI